MASIAGITGASLSSAYGTTTTDNTQNTTQTVPQDTVKLSTQAQALLLYHQGQSVNSIAAALGATTKQVDDYLGITLQQELQQTLQSTQQAG